MSDSNGRIVLLSAIDAVGEVIVGGDAIKLCGGLVVIRRPVYTAIERDLPTAIVSNHHPFAIVGCDPKVVVIAMRSADRRIGFATIIRTMESDIQHIDFIDILSPRVNSCVVPSALTQLAFIIHFRPTFTTIAGPKNATIFRFNDRPNSIGVDRRNIDTNNAERSLRKPFFARDFVPRFTAVRAFPKPRTLATTFKTVGCSQDSPSRCVNSSWIRRIHDQVHCTHFVIDE